MNKALNGIAGGAHAILALAAIAALLAGGLLFGYFVIWGAARLLEWATSVAPL